MEYLNVTRAKIGQRHNAKCERIRRSALVDMVASPIDYECDIPICETCYLYCRAHFIHKQLTHHRITFICSLNFVFILRVFSLILSHSSYMNSYILFFTLLLLGCKRIALWLVGWFYFHSHAILAWNFL